jgi:hypothetical protein
VDSCLSKMYVDGSWRVWRDWRDVEGLEGLEGCVVI